MLLKGNGITILIYQQESDSTMTLPLKLIKLASKVLVALLSVIVVCYIALLLINFQDKAPSEAAITMQALQQIPEHNPDNNGYLYFARYDSAVKYQLSEPLEQLMRQCALSDCNATLMTQPELATLVAQHQELSNFYQQVRSFNHWYEPIPTDAAQVLPSFRSLLNGQKLLLVQAWLAAQQQDVVTVRQLLQQDLQFWRNMLRKNTLLINKMVSTAAIQSHFKFGTTIKQQLAEQHHSTMQPQSWLTPFTAEELSMLLALSGEWAYGNNVIESLLLAAPTSNDSTLSEKTTWLLLKPLFQPQASSNQRASWLLAYSNGEPAADLPWYSWLYNPVGKIINSTDELSFSSYQARLDELEPARQQAISQAVKI